MSIDALRRPSPWPFTVLVAGIAAAFLPVAAGYVKRYSLPLSSAACIYGCFLLLLVYVVAPAMPAARALLEKVVAGQYKAAIVLALLALPYVAYAAGTADFRWAALARLVAIAAPVVLLYSAFPVRDRTKLNCQDALVAVWLVSIVLFHLFKGIWNV